MACSTDTTSTPNTSIHNSPLSPATSMSLSHHDEEGITVSALDDIFGSSPADVGYELNESAAWPTGADNLNASSANSEHPNLRAKELSELPIARRQHVTAGYRDAIAISKQSHLQRGFDEGYPYGAKLGLRAGIIRGVLEGLVNSQLDDVDFAALVKDLRARSEEKLEVSNVFAKVADVVSPGAEREIKVGATDQEPPHVILDCAGDHVISQWEDTVNEIFAKLTSETKDA